MKKLRILGLVTMLVLIIIIAALAVLAMLGILKIEENTDGTGSHISFTPIENKNGWEIPEDAERTAVIKTDLGNITVLLSDTAAADAFISLDNEGAFDGGEFSTLAKDMFIQADIEKPDFDLEKTDFACIGKTVGFVMNGEKASPSFFIITNEKLSGISESYMTEQGFDKEKIALYEKNGGMPEYEGKVIIFGKVISGMETALKIAGMENSGYTGGYSAAEPVKINSVEIIYQTETTE